MATTLADRNASFIGQEVGSYTVESLLGSGGMGQVYLARDRKLNRRIALKILPLEFSSDPERLHRFESEARAVSVLNHPNIVTIHDFGQQSGWRSWPRNGCAESQRIRTAATAASDSAAILRIWWMPRSARGADAEGAEAQVLLHLEEVERLVHVGIALRGHARLAVVLACGRRGVKRKRVVGGCGCGCGC